MRSTQFVICLGAIVFSLLLSCSKDKIELSELNCPPEEVTFNNQIQPFLVQTCAYSGCHNGTPGIGIYSLYSEISRDIENGIFQKEVFDLRTMPPDYAPDDKPQSLTEEELELLNCWITAGYPEN